MKKYIYLLLFALSMVFTVQAQVAEKKDTTIDQGVQQVVANVSDFKQSLAVTDQANPNVVYIIEKLEVLAKSLKTTAEHMYSVLVKRQYLWGITTVSIFIFCLFLSILLFVFQYWSRSITNNKRKTEKNISLYDWDDSWYPVAWVASIVFFLTSLIGSFICASDVANALANPEYGAIKEILNILR